MRTPVIGFDLDLTLIDSRPGIAATLRELSARTGVFIDAEAAVTRLGPPLDDELTRWYPAAEVPAAAEIFRELYPALAVHASPALPGVPEAFAAVEQRNGAIVVITGKYEPNARLHLDHLGLRVDAVVGWAWGDGKTEALRVHGAQVYVGDHPGDMSAARRAGVLAVGVLTGHHDAASLTAAGADTVLTDLRDFPDWLLGQLKSRRISVGLGGSDR
jgi:phosphoglycolate phosphatase